MLQSKPTNQAFSDGLVRIYAVTNAAEAGNKPVERLALKHTLRYEQRIVGMSRHYVALQANVKISHVLRCPRLATVSTQDIAKPNDGRQYRIVQVQYPPDVVPPCMDLTLEEVAAQYELG